MKRYVLMYRKFQDDPGKRNKFYGGNIAKPAPLNKAWILSKKDALECVELWDRHSNPKVPRAPWNREFGDKPLTICEVELTIKRTGVEDEG